MSIRKLLTSCLHDPERYLKLGGETRDVTILFADLRDFTPFSASHTRAAGSGIH